MAIYKGDTLITGDGLTYTQDSIGTAINPLDDYYNKSATDTLLNAKANKSSLGVVSLYSSASGKNSGTISLGDVSSYSLLQFCMAQNDGTFSQQSTFVTETLFTIGGNYLGLYGYDNLYVNVTVSGSLTNLTLSLTASNNLKIYKIYGIKL